MGLREQKKEETRKLLLAKARELFEAKGFERVTTAEIARAARIAEGTVFNYYSSKADLFLAAVMPPAMLEELRPPAVVPDQVGPQQLAASTTALLDQYLSHLAQVSKRLLRDYLAVVYSVRLSEADEARQRLLTMDEQMVQLVVDFLSSQKEAHPAQLADFDVRLATSCIFSCVVALLSQYVLLDDWTYERLKQSIYDQTLFILKGHIPE